MVFEEDKQPDEDQESDEYEYDGSQDCYGTFQEEEEEELTESDDQISESNKTESVDDTEESIDETPRSSQKSARVISFDDQDQIVESPSKKTSIQMVDLKKDMSSQNLVASSGLLKQTPSYSQKKRERRKKKKEFEMKKLAEKQLIK